MSVWEREMEEREEQGVSLCPICLSDVYDYQGIHPECEILIRESNEREAKRLKEEKI